MKLEKSLQEAELIEIGPRFALNPIKIFDGFMKGEVLYDNPFYVAPRKLRRDQNALKAEQYLRGQEKRQKRNKVKQFVIPSDGLDEIFADELAEAGLQ